MRTCTLAVALFSAFCLSACTKKESQFAGIYQFEGRDTVAGDQVTTAKIQLDPDGTASATIRSKGYIEAIGTTKIDISISGKGTWTDRGETAEANITVTEWLDSGRTLAPTDPLKLTVKGGAMPSISAPSIKPKNGPSYVPAFSPLFGEWTREPLP